MFRCLFDRADQGRCSPGGTDLTPSQMTRAGSWSRVSRAAVGKLPCAAILVLLPNYLIGESFLRSEAASVNLSISDPRSGVGGRGLSYKGRTVYAVGSGSFWLLGDPYFYDAQGRTNLARVRGHLDKYKPQSPNGVGVGVIRVGAWATPLRYSGVDPGMIRYPCARAGVGRANDGGRAFDCSKLDQSYFDHLLSVAREADSRGILLGIVLWDEIPLERGATRWNRHPFCRDNNVVDYELPPCDSNAVPEFFDTANLLLRSHQDAIVRRFVETVKSEPNVFLFVSNEYTGPADWRERQIGTIDDQCFIVGCDLMHVTMDYHLGPSTTSAGVSAGTRDDGFGSNSYRADGRPAINHRDNAAWSAREERQGMWRRLFDGAASGGTRDDYTGATTPSETFQKASAEDEAIRRFINSIVTDLSDMPPDSRRFHASGAVWHGRASAGREYIAYSPRATAEVTVDLRGETGLWELFEWDVDADDPVGVSAGVLAGGRVQTWHLRNRGDVAIRIVRTHPREER